MNQSNAHLYLPLVEALASGKTIQIGTKAGDDWKDVAEPTFNFLPSAYRVKPEPREWTLYRHNEHNSIFTCDDADAYFPVGQRIRVREILS